MLLDEASEAVLAFDFSKVRGRCMRQLGWSEAFVDRVLVEYRRFLVLKVRCESATATVAELSPSDTLEALWELQVLDTADYSVKLFEACGRVILHEPDEVLSDVAARKVRAEKTKLCYLALFNSHPPVDIWDYKEVAVVAAKDRRSPPVTRSAKRKRERPVTEAVFVKSLTGKEHTIYVDLESGTVGSLMEKLENLGGLTFKKNVGLLFAGKRLQAEKLFADYNIKRESTLHVVGRLRGC